MLTPISRRRLARALAALVLLAGLSALFVRHAPATTWSVPIRSGQVLDGWRVDDVRRTEFEVRVELSQGDVHRAVRWVDGSNDERPIRARAGHVTLLTDAVTPPIVPDAVLAAMVDAIVTRDAARPAPPAFVAPKTTHVPTRAQVETILLELLLVTWLASMVASAPQIAGWLGGVGPAAWAWLAGLVGAQAAFVRVMGIGGAWHSNQHGFDRIADVEQGTAPTLAALGLLHGHGYYVLFEPLYALFGGRVGVFVLSQGVHALGLIALFAWLHGLWGRPRAALLGVAFAASLPIALRLSASEDMYVPTVAWMCVALALVEVWLRTGSWRALALAVTPALLAMQTRAELLLLMPAWIVLAWVGRRPDRLRAALVDARLWGLVGAAALALVPRGLAILASPPPAELRRTASDPMADPRLVVLAAVGLGLVAAHPALRAWIGAVVTSRRGRAALAASAALVAGVGGAAYVAALRAQGGPLQRTWQVHAAFDPALVAPWVSCLVIVGLWIALLQTPRRGVVLGLSVVGAWWIYLPQFDCLSTFVRTGLSTVPFLAALAAVALDAIVARAGTVAGGFVVAGLLGGGVAFELRWMTVRDAKAAYWDLVEVIRATVPPGTHIVWLSDDDAPPDARQAGMHLDRARLDRHLGPAYDVLSVRAWTEGAVTDAQPVWFARTPDCARVLLSDRGRTGLAGDRSITWRYLDVSRLATTARIALEGVDSHWIDPTCSRALLTSRSARWTRVPDPRNAGSIFETAVGADTTLGLYVIPARVAAPGGD